MKFFNFFFSLLIISLNSFCQIQDTYQSAAVYKSNRVKSRILMYDYNRYNTKIVDMFDTNGLVTEHVQFDTTGQKILTRSKLKYDSNQKLISEIILNYLYRYDSLAKTMTLTSVADTLVAEIRYDSLNRVIKEEFRNFAGKIMIESKNTFNPFIKTQKKFSPADSIYSETIYYFDVPCIENKINYTQFSSNGKQKAWSFTFKNRFDKTGKIISRSITRDPDLPDSEKLQYYFKKESFQYMKSGLLLNKLSFDLSDNSGRISRQIFDYKFW